MPKIKSCPHCKQVLICQACGQRFTPDLKGTYKLKTTVDENTITLLREEARKEGISINAFLKRKFGGEKKPTNSRRRAASSES